MNYCPIVIINVIGKLCKVIVVMDRINRGWSRMV